MANKVQASRASHRYASHPRTFASQSNTNTAPDEAYSYTDIEGVWLIDVRIFDEPGILVMLSDGRAVQFPTSRLKPGLQQTMRLWYSDYDGKQVRFRPCQSAKGWVRGVEPADDGWIMTAETEREQLRFHCTQLSAELFPDWYQAMLAMNLEKMMIDEKT